MKRRDLMKAMVGLPVCLLVPELERRSFAGVDLASGPDWHATVVWDPDDIEALKRHQQATERYHRLVELVQAGDPSAIAALPIAASDYLNTAIDLARLA